MPRSTIRFPAFVLAALALGLAPAAWAGGPGGLKPTFTASAALGGFAGLEDLARGGVAGADLGFFWSPPRQGEGGSTADRGATADHGAGTGTGGTAGAGLAAHAAITLDRGLAAAPALALRLGLVLLAGEDLRVEAGIELPLARAPLALSSARIPWRLALGTVVLELAPGGGRRPRLSLDCELSWTSYAPSPWGSGAVGAGTGAGSDEPGLAAFEAGVRAALLLRASSPRQP